MNSQKKEYTCPMHPQIRRPNPGQCPICGMNLEPTVVSENEEDPELKNMTRRFWVGVLLTLPIIVLVLLETKLIDRFLSYKSYALIQTLLATPVVLWAGFSFFRRGWRSIVTLKLNMFTLIALGIGAAYFYSLVAALFPFIFPLSFQTRLSVFPICPSLRNLSRNSVKTISPSPTTA